MKSSESMNDWLTPEQLHAVNLIVERKRAIIWWRVGEGKTRIALEAYVRLTQCKTSLLVICSPTAFRTWQDEAKLHPVFGDLIRLEFISSGLLSQNNAIDKIRKLSITHEVGMVAVDELWMYKRLKTIRSRNVTYFTSAYPTVGLSGSLITNRNIEDIYGQACAVGLGNQIARSLTHFRTQFCVSYEDFGLKFTAKKGALPAIQQRLAPFCDIYFPADVRESRIYRTTVDPTEEQVKLFDTCQNDYYMKLENETTEVEIKSAPALIIKLQQISDGVVLDSEGNRSYLQSSKIERLLGILEEYADGGQRVLVWFAFKASLACIYDKLGKTATAMSSDHEFDSEGWRVGRYKFALATIGSGASINDFANVQHAIIYSAPFSHRAMQQAMGRTNRKSSEHTVCYYQFLQTDRGIDSLVYDSIRLTGEIEKTAIANSIDIVRKYMQTYGRII
jgi:hypothetical protein